MQVDNFTFLLGELNEDNTFFYVITLNSSTLQSLLDDWLDIQNEQNENATSAAVIQIILECLDKSFGGHGVFRICHRSVDLRTFDWITYFEGIVNQYYHRQFNFVIQRDHATAIGEMIAKFTENTEDINWLQIFSRFIRTMCQSRELAQLIAQVPVHLIFGISTILCEDLNDEPRRALEQILNYTIATVNVHMRCYAARTQFATTFYNRLVHNLEIVDIDHLSRLIIRFVTCPDDKLNTLAFSNIYAILNAQHDGYDELLAICCTQEFIAALNDILDNRKSVALLRYAFRIAILIQK